MPVEGRIPTISGPAGDIDDPAPSSRPLPVQDRATAQVGAGLEIHLKGMAPGVVPGLEVGGGQGGFENARIVDEYIDAAIQPRQRSFPKAVGGVGISKVGAEDVRPLMARVADDASAARN